MFKCALLSLIIVYIPSIIIGHNYFNSAKAYYLSAYLPHFLLIVLFGYRIRLHLKNMFKKYNETINYVQYNDNENNTNYQQYIEGVQGYLGLDNTQTNSNQNNINYQQYIDQK